MHVSDFWIDEKDKKVYVMAWGINTIKEYDFSGNFIKSFKFSFGSLQFLKNNNNSFTFVIPNKATNLDSEFRLIITDSTGNEKLRFKNYNRVHNTPMIATKIPMYYFNDTVRILESRVDTLNSFANGRHIPYAIFNFGTYKLNPHLSIPLEPNAREELNNRVKDKLWIWSIHENHSYFFLTFFVGLADSLTFGVYNKENAEISFFNKGGFEDDLGIGIPFWPKYIYCDSLLIDYQDAYKILNAIKKGKSTETNNTKLTQTYVELNTLQETSNPVLIILESDK